MKKAAIIDIGSNSIRYMTIERTSSGVRFSDKLRCTTRLASGLLATGSLQFEPMMLSYNAIAHFTKLAAAEGCPVYAYATSAVRDALNRNEFLSLLEPLNIELSVLTGADEGRYAYLAACKNGGSLIDIGGGSTQLVSVDNGKSFPIGCVRAKDYCYKATYSELKQQLFDWFETVYQIDYPLPAPFVGVGGTITTLGALLMNQKDYSGLAFGEFSFTHDQLEFLLIQLFELGDERRLHPLLSKRHDVIIPGGLILLYLMERFSIHSIIPSDVDGMEGFAMEKCK